MAKESVNDQKPKASTKRRSGNGKRPIGGGRRKDRDTFPYVEVSVTFSHPIVHRAYEKFFDRYRQCFFHVTASLQKARLEESLDLVYEHLEKQIDEAETALAQADQELAALIKSKLGDQEIRTKIPKKETVKARVPGSLVRRYLNLFPLLDKYIDAVIFAETMGVITHTKKRELMKNCPRYVTTVTGRFQSLAHGIDVKNRSHDEIVQSVRTVLDEHLAMKPIAEKRPLTTVGDGEQAQLNGSVETQSAAEAWGQ